MSNRGYSSSAGGYGQQNYYTTRPSYQNGGYDQDQRYYAQSGGSGGGGGRPYRPERPEYYDTGNTGNGYGGGYGGGGGYTGSSGSGSGSGYGGHRGGAYDEISFRPWDQTYRYVMHFFF